MRIKFMPNTLPKIILYTKLNLIFIFSHDSCLYRGRQVNSLLSELNIPHVSTWTVLARQNEAGIKENLYFFFHTVDLKCVSVREYEIYKC